MPHERILVTPSILACDFGHLQEEVDSVADADGLQVDVMDGHFVPNLTFGAPVIRSLRTALPLDIHLMVTNPADRLEEFLVLNEECAGRLRVQNITFHAEALPALEDQRRLVAAIHQGGCTAGIALNPETSLEAINELLSSPFSPVDLVLCMTVHPGFSGQEFQRSVLPKIRELRRRFPSLPVQVDGGIDVGTAKQCREAGATNLVAASAVFGSSDRRKVIEALRGS
jgi:ribulose-phosphate 3-epimerase